MSMLETIGKINYSTAKLLGKCAADSFGIFS